MYNPNILRDMAMKAGPEDPNKDDNDNDGSINNFIKSNDGRDNDYDSEGYYNKDVVVNGVMVVPYSSNRGHSRRRGGGGHAVTAGAGHEAESEQCTRTQGCKQTGGSLHHDKDHDPLEYFKGGEEAGQEAAGIAGEEECCPSLYQDSYWTR